MSVINESNNVNEGSCDVELPHPLPNKDKKHVDQDSTPLRSRPMDTDTDVSETMRKIALSNRLERAEVIDNEATLLDTLRPLKFVGNMAKNLYPSNEIHSEFGPYGLTKKFFGDKSELMEPESRITRKQMEEIEDIDITKLPLSYKIDSQMISWRLKKREDSPFEIDERVNIHRINKLLDIKNQEKTFRWINMMSSGTLDPSCLASAMIGDQFGVQKGPMLLGLVSFVLADITGDESKSVRTFKFYLEYGIGERCLRWNIIKSSDQLESLHRRLTIFVKEPFDLIKKQQIQFPALPKLQRKDGQTQYENKRGESGARRSIVNGFINPPMQLSESVADSEKSSHLKRISTKAFKNFHTKYKLNSNKRYMEEIQSYLEHLIEAVLFKEPSTRIFQFLEMSPFSMLLNNEINKKRKEGTLFITTTAKQQGWRVGHLKFHDLTEMVDRHTNKWVILGDSFITYTSDFSSTTPLDVFLFDSKTKVDLREKKNSSSSNNDNEIYDHSNAKISAFTNISNTLKLKNGERKLKLSSMQASVLRDWEAQITEAKNLCDWGKPNRFGSFAPVRDNAFAQWFVDARDYMYAASSAIEMAKDVIYIHDWWLSPELYLRRPANGNQDWRIDRLLKRKAQQGVKIFIIIYRNVGNTVVTDSLYTKHSLLDLDTNIYVLRSPNQIMQNVFFWAHHEKLLIIDNAVCFLGGIDLCFGRWDTPDHVLTDDGEFSYKHESDMHFAHSNYNSTLASSTTPTQSTRTKNKIDDTLSNDAKELNKINDGTNSFHMFPGKDYSNPRKKDFFNLTEPNQDMYDRKVTPRMPWHDIHMVTGGQVARDLARHFVQRWNYLIRQKRPSRPTPLLLPPRSFTEKELKDLNLTGTCEVQLLRSICDWSLGLTEHEQSIHDAYVKNIEISEHFVYIENQFFVTSCKYNGVIVRNSIGDALVDRIIQAHKKSESWRAIIVIPLMPGFEAEVDSKEGGSVRLIMQLQYMSISMGDTSIFARLRRVGIDPEEYIQFYSLRKWGMIGPKKLLTTEQLYIHAKCMIVDDRIAIIGSANINERSMRGNRDSEVAAIVRDRHMINSTMDGQKYKVGHFAHTLRVRLMREHLGVDVDLLDLVERRFNEIEKFAKSDIGIQAAVLDTGNIHLSAMIELGTRYLLDLWEGTKEFNELGKVNVDNNILKVKLLTGFKKTINQSSNEDLDDLQYACSFNHRAGKANRGLRNNKAFSSDTRVTNKEHRTDVRGMGQDGYNRNSFVKAKLQLNDFLKDCVNKVEINDGAEIDVLPSYEDVLSALSQHVVENGSTDEINMQKWKIIKKLFYLRKLYSKQILELQASHSKSQHSDSSTTDGPMNMDTPDIPCVKLTDAKIKELDETQLPQLKTTFIDPWSFEDPLSLDFLEGTWIVQALRNTVLYRMAFHCQPDDSVQTWRDYKLFEEQKKAFNDYQEISCGAFLNGEIGQFESISAKSSNSNELSTEEEFELNSDTSFDNEKSMRRLLRRKKLAELRQYMRGINNAMGVSQINSKVVYDYETTKKLLSKIQGNVVFFPTRWLKREVEGSNWFFKADRIPPIQIYD